MTAQEVERAPASFVAAHRSQLAAIIWTLVLSAAFLTLLSVTGDTVTAAFFAVIATAAASILLLPLVMCVLCAGEHAEIAWLCRRSPKVAACVAYREALARHRATTTTIGASRGRTWFLNAGRTATRMETGRRLEARGFRVEPVEAPDIEGFDLLVRADDRTVVVRCLPGHQPADPAVGREMSAVVADRHADLGVIVTATGPTPELRRYLESHRLTVLDPIDLPTAVI